MPRRTITRMLSRLRIDNLVLIHEAELDFVPGLNVITGETGAGKTILAQAFGLLLGTKGEAGLVGIAGEDAYVEAELDVPSDLLAGEVLETLTQLRPEDEDGLVLARRVFADGRTRAYAWAGQRPGRTWPAQPNGSSPCPASSSSVASRVPHTSSTFSTRSPAPTSSGAAQIFASPGASSSRHVDATTSSLGMQMPRRRVSPSCAHSWRTPAGFEPGLEDALRAERERFRHTGELVEAAATAVSALDPDDGEGAADLIACRRAVDRGGRAARARAQPGGGRAARRRASSPGDGERAAGLSRVDRRRSRVAPRRSRPAWTRSPTPSGGSGARATTSCWPTPRRPKRSSRSSARAATRRPLRRRHSRRRSRR